LAPTVVDEIGKKARIVRRHDVATPLALRPFPPEDGVLLLIRWAGARRWDYLTPRDRL